MKPLTLFVLSVPHSAHLIMFQSQYSDAFSSSFYDGRVEDITYLASENALLFTPDLIESQQTIDSSDTEFLRPAPRPIVPSSLTRVGPGRSKAYVLYTRMVHEEFVQWWLETEYGRTRKLEWEAPHPSAIWEQFDQVADGVSGTAKVMCKRCGQILEHPYSLNPKTASRHGTSTITRHLKTASCVQSARERVRRSDITKFIRSDASCPLSYLIFC